MAWQRPTLNTALPKRPCGTGSDSAKAHQSFAVLRHPVARLHSAFVNHILMPGPECYREIREILRKTYGLAIPEKTPDDGYDAAAHRSAFLQFAAFVKANLSGQTSIRVDGAWASQSEILRGVCQFMIPDHVFREDEIDADLAYLAQKVGMSSPVYQPDHRARASFVDGNL